MPEDAPTRPPVAVTVIKLAWCCLLASVVAAALMFPVVGGFGLVSNRASDVVANGSAQLVEGEVPQVSTMVDAFAPKYSTEWGSSAKFIRPLMDASEKPPSAMP